MTAFTHKQSAVNCFNAAWDLLDLKERTCDEAERMIHLAHTSFYHWTQVEEHTAKNVSIGYWQLSRVYAVSGLGERAQFFSERCLEVSLENELEPFYIGYACEAMSRAYALLGNVDEANNYLDKAKSYAEKIKDERSREMLLNDLNTL